MTKYSLKNKTILITGGTGSLGKAIVKTLIENKIEFKKIIIFSRDELKQSVMQNSLNKKIINKFRFFIGDIRDKDRLKRAVVDTDIVIHAAALKQIPTAEYNPFECIKTNIFGSQNLIEACLDAKVEKVIALSTDKASSPINLYGATKLCSDKLFIAANNIKGKRKIIFNVVRYGNVLGSRGSVIPYFIELNNKNKILSVTDAKMTRFNILISEGVDLILKSLESNLGGQVFIPKIPSYRILDLVKAINAKAKIKIIGIRSGEKLHEEMISSSDSYRTIQFKSYYSILPFSDKNIITNYIKKNKAKPVETNFNYSSDTNAHFLSVAELTKMIDHYINENTN